MTTILLVGSGAREHAIAQALAQSQSRPKIAAFMGSANPGIRQLASFSEQGKVTDVDAIARFAQRVKPELCIVGPEAPLAAGVVDKLDGHGIPSFGPFREEARLESSKGFTRELMKKHRIPGAPRFEVFDDEEGVEKYMRELGESVIKPDGLTGGKGVLVQGEHFRSAADGALAAKLLIREGSRVVIEEKLVGEEFSLQSITDGKHVVDCPPVQDHKRAFVGDSGPNTGGMGSYSDANHLLPFLEARDVSDAHAITEKVLAALTKETKTKYRGVMYGGFMATKDGVKLIEYNARFGDPEAMNVIPLMRTDFVEMCRRVIDGTLKSVEFERKASVCKYLVPRGYPTAPEAGIVKVGKVEQGTRVFYAAVEQKPDGLHLTSSRAIALSGFASTIAEAEEIVERNAARIEGPLFHRADIGTGALIQKRIEHMKQVRG